MRNLIGMLGLVGLLGCVGVPYQGAVTTEGHEGSYLAGAGGSPVETPQSDTSDPARIPVYGVSDAILGYLVLGRSTPADAGRVLEGNGGLGPARPNEVVFRVGAATLRPNVVYTPPGTLHQLYFDQDTLVLAVAGAPHGLPATRVDFEARFPGTRETHRESAWYELQAPLSRCIWLIAVFTAGSDRLDSSGSARVC